MNQSENEFKIDSEGNPNKIFLDEIKMEDKCELEQRFKIITDYI